MARKKVNYYKFTPGAAGVGTVKVMDNYDLGDFLMITNVTTNTVIYNFGDPNRGGTVSFVDAAALTDNVFSALPGVPQSVNNGVTTLTLDFDTTSMSANDVLQIYVETVELRIRTHDFGIDAVERARVAIPRSLIDADFEYGLQTTKWASFFTYRSTPTTLAFDGTDFSVNAFGYATLTTGTLASVAGAAGSGNIPTSVGILNQGNVTFVTNTFTGGGATSGQGVVPIGAFVNDSAPRHHADDYKMIIAQPLGTGAPRDALRITNARPITLANGGQFQRTFAVNSTTSLFPGDVLVAVGLPVIDAGLPIAQTPRVHATVLTAISSAATTSLVSNTMTATFATSGVNAGNIMLAVEIGPLNSGQYELMNVDSLTPLAPAAQSVTYTVQRRVLGSGDATNSADIRAGARIFMLSGGYTTVAQTHINQVNAVELMRIDHINTSTNELTVTRGWMGSNANVFFGNGTVLGVVNLRPFNTYAQWTSNVEIVKVAHAVGGGDAGAAINPQVGTSWNYGAQSPAKLGFLRNPLSTSYPNAGLGLPARTAATPPGSVVVTLNAMSMVGNASVPLVLINANAAGISIANTSSNIGNSWISTYGATGSYLNANVEAVFQNVLPEMNYVAFAPKFADTAKYPGYPLIPGSEAAVVAPRFRKGGLYQAANLVPLNGNVVFSSNGGNPSLITVRTQHPHGVLPGTPIQVTMAGVDGAAVHGSGVQLVNSADRYNFSYIAKGTVGTNAVLTTLTNAGIFAFPTALVKHRPLDGGTNIGINAPSYGFEATRQTRKYFRYQSGKGMMFTTGTQFNPVFSIANVSANTGAVGAGLTVSASSAIQVTTVVEHGLQRGANVTIYGVSTAGYSGTFKVDAVDSSFSFRVKNTATLGAANPVITGANVADQVQNPRVTVLNWTGSKVRAGMFDDGNGVFWEYDGQYLWAVKRSATGELIGSINVGIGENRVTGDSNTRFQDNLAAGEQIQIRGIVHDIVAVESQNTMYITPRYIGAQNAVNIPYSVVREVRTRSANFNLDRLDGSGPSGYVINLSKMQMVAIQYTWYGAGFIDWGMRTTDGQMIWAHRLKNNNVNDEGYMRSGNLPARYQAVNRGAVTQLTVALTATEVANIQVAEIDEFPEVSTTYPGIVLVGDELIRYTAKHRFTHITGNTQGNLGGLTRVARYAPVVLGAQRDLTGISTAQAAAVGAPVIQFDCSASPDLNHWGSAVILDGDFDIDRTYSFTYSLNGAWVSASIGQPQTLFMIRLAPSLGSGVPGDLGIRDTLNRAQLLLQNCYINFSATDARALLVGVVNPINIDFAAWQPINQAANQFAPSFSQFVANVSSQLGGNVSAGTNSQTSQIRWAPVLNPPVLANNTVTGSGVQIIPYAYGGEQLFSIPVSGTNSGFIDLSRVKEIGGAIFPGNQVYPNGPEVVAFNIIPVRKVGADGAAFRGDFAVDFQLTWIESQA